MILDGGNHTGGSMGNLGEMGGDGEENRRGNKGRWHRVGKRVAM